MLKYKNGNITDDEKGINFHGGSMPSREAELKVKGLKETKGRSLCIIAGNGAGHMACEFAKKFGEADFIIFEPKEEIYKLSLKNRDFFSVCMDENFGLYLFTEHNLSKEAVLRILLVKAGLPVIALESSYMKKYYSDFLENCMKTFKSAAEEAASAIRLLNESGISRRDDNPDVIVRECLLSASRGEAGQ